MGLQRSARDKMKVHGMAEPCGGAVQRSEPCGGAVRRSEPCGGAVQRSEPCGRAVQRSEPCGRAVRRWEPCGGAVQRSEPCGAMRANPAQAQDMQRGRARHTGAEMRHSGAANGEANGERCAANGGRKVQTINRRQRKSHAPPNERQRTRKKMPRFALGSAGFSAGRSAPCARSVPPWALARGSWCARLRTANACRRVAGR